MMKDLSQTVAFFAVIVLFSGCADDGSDGNQPADPKKSETSETLDYEVLATVEYTGQGRYSQQSSGVMTVDKRSSESGEVGYVYSMVTDTTGDGGKTVGEVTLPAATIVRDPATERVVGGARLLKNLGVVANQALDQISRELPLDGTTLTRKFTFHIPDEFPGDLSYQLKARRQQLESGGNSVAVLAVSSPFEYGIPESSTRVKGRHRVLCLLSDDMNDVLYLCNNFTATAPEKDRIGELRIESLMYQLRDSEPISLAGLDEEFTRYFERLDLSGTVEDASSDTGLPRWAMHSLAVRDSVDIVAGAAIEGRPNFAVCATVGLALLLDSAASTTTALLHEADVIDWEYKGVTNYAGQGYGLMFAQGFERIRGRDVDEQKWMDIGGVTGDLAALLIPQQVLGSGVKVGTGGVKIIKGTTLAGKSLRVGKHGLDLVRTGKGWQSSESIVNNLLDAKRVVGTIRWGIEADRVSDKYAAASGQDDRPSGQSPMTVMSYLPNDAFAVIVFRVQAATRWLDRENVEIPAVAVELVKSQLGIDIRNVRELVIPFAGDDPEAMAALVRFDNPYDKDKLAKADFLKDDHALKEHGDVQYFREAGGDVCLCPVDQRTLIFGPEPGMKKMLDATGGTSPLAKSVADLGADHAVLVAAQFAGTPAALGEMLDDVPPDIAELVEGNKVGLVKAWLTLEPEAQFGATVTTTDAESASILKAFVEKGLGQVGKMLGADASPILRMLPPGFEPEDVDFLRQMHGKVEVATMKSRLDVTIKIPSGFESVVRKTLKAFESAKGSAEVSLARAQMKMFEQCLMIYRLHLRAYPTTEQGLEALIEVPDNEANDRWRGPYLDAEAIPLDPWGNPYQYELLNAGTVRLRSLGPDGVSGTEDDVTNNEDAEVRPRKGADGGKPTDALQGITNSIGMEFKQIRAGEFLMGERCYDEWGEVVDHPHHVTLTRGFQIGVYEVTQEQYEKVMRENPSDFKGSRNPVERVSWEDAVEFCRKLSALPQEKSAGVVYRLPTEAEWEYACRAGTTTAYSFGDNASRLREYAWIGSNSNDKTHPVGQKKPNAWGLHDMHGNVVEWCEDWHGAFSSRAVTDPQGEESGSKRVGRGGDWKLLSSTLGRSTIRFVYAPSSRLNSLGFRVVRSVSRNADSRP